MEDQLSKGNKKNLGKRFWTMNEIQSVQPEKLAHFGAHFEERIRRYDRFEKLCNFGVGYHFHFVRHVFMGGNEGRVDDRMSETIQSDINGSAIGCTRANTSSCAE